MDDSIAAIEHFFYEKKYPEGLQKLALLRAID